MTKVAIGVTTPYGRGRWNYCAQRLAIWRAGGKAHRLRANRPHDLDALDGFVVGGGDDISADLYGGTIMPEVRVDPERDRMELDVVAHAMQTGKPVLGICRGAQMLNVALGGDLHEDIYEVYVEAPRMRTVLPRKTVDIFDGTRLASLMTCNPCRVNALHHQSVDRLGEGLRVAARDRAGIVQGIESADRFLLGVQWHPELLIFSRNQQRLYRALTEAAQARQGHHPVATDPTGP